MRSVCPDTCVVVMLGGELKSKLLLAEGNVKVALELRTISQLLLTLLKFKNMKEDPELGVLFG